MKQIICILWIVMPLSLIAQKQKEKIQYSGLYQFGITVGKAYTAINAQMVQAVKYKNYEAGAGVALDQYGFRTVPVFAHFGYSLYPQKNSVYFYTDAGVSIPWNTGALPEKYTNTNNEWHKLHTGLYTEAGIGYRFMINRKNAITFNGGYSYKKFRYDEYTVIWNGISTDNQKDVYIFNYHRLTFRIGVAL